MFDKTFNKLLTEEMGIIRNVQTDTMAIADKIKHLIKNTAKCIAIKKKNQNINKKHFKWLGLQRLDFYLPDYNTAIECQGRQHFMLIEQYNEKDKLEKQIKLDAEKKKKCEDNNVRLLYYAELEYDYPYKVFTDLDKLLKEIKNGK